MPQSRLSAVIITAGLALAGTAHSQQQPTVPVECAGEDGLMAMLKEYQEKPMLIGTSTRRQGGQSWDFPVVLFTNASTGSWTLVEEHGPDLYCAVAMGGDIRPFYQSVQK
jgi:hypothetical protein